MVAILVATRGGVLVLQRRFSNVLVEQTNTSPTLEVAMGCGGGNIPIVLASFEGNGQRPSHNTRVRDYLSGMERCSR